MIDIFLYTGELNPNDILLSDPTVLRTTTGVLVPPSGPPVRTPKYRRQVSGSYIPPVRERSIADEDYREELLKEEREERERLEELKRREEEEVREEEEIVALIAVAFTTLELWET